MNRQRPQFRTARQLVQETGLELARVETCMRRCQLYRFAGVRGVCVDANEWYAKWEKVRRPEEAAL